MKTLLTALVVTAFAALAMASGVTPSNLTAANGTTPQVISAIPATYWGMEVSSATAGDQFKCWNASSVGTLTISSAATLGALQYQTASPGKGPAAIAVSASVGIVCAKSAAADEALIYTSPF